MVLIPLVFIEAKGASILVQCFGRASVAQTALPAVFANRPGALSHRDGLDPFGFALKLIIDRGPLAATAKKINDALRTGLARLAAFRTITAKEK